MPNKHEPGFDKIIKESSVFLNTVGMRLAPEILIQELFRDVFFDSAPNSRTQVLKPDGVDPVTQSNFFNDKEKAVLSAFRGRRKQVVQSKSDDFYAPAYPSLARGGWFRKGAERVIKYQLFAGPLGLYLARNETEKDEAVRVMLEAFLGNRRVTGGNVSGMEFFSSALKASPLDGTYEQWEQNIHDLLENSATNGFIEDDLATRIYLDFMAICRLEEHVPRLQWLDILMTFMRLALPTWFIAQSRISIMLRDWLVAAVDNETVLDLNEIVTEIKGRYRELFHPTEVPTLEPNEHVVNYIKARVELNVAINLFERAGITELKDKVLSFSSIHAGMITADKLLLLAKANRSNILALVNSAGTLRKHLTREGETWNAWRNPLNIGQGKNFEEFLRVLYKAKEGDDTGGYLLSRIAGQKNQGFLVFPGHQLAKTMVMLAAMERKRCNSGRLLIKDVERHFSLYGIEFGAVAGARPRLLSMLSELGLLKGSPDAGEFSEVVSPYNIT